MLLACLLPPSPNVSCATYCIDAGNSGISTDFVRLGSHYQCNAHDHSINIRGIYIAYVFNSGNAEKHNDKDAYD